MEEGTAQGPKAGEAGRGEGVSCKDKKAAPADVRRGFAHPHPGLPTAAGFLWLEQDRWEKAEQAPKPPSLQAPAAAGGSPDSFPGSPQPSRPSLALSSSSSSRQSPLLPPRARGRSSVLSACSPRPRGAQHLLEQAGPVEPLEGHCWRIGGAPWPTPREEKKAWPLGPAVRALGLPTQLPGCCSGTRTPQVLRPHTAVPKP